MLSCAYPSLELSGSQMDVTYILLGMLWLYDLDVTSCDKSNTYAVVYNIKKIVLAPPRPKGSSENHNNKSITLKARKKPLHLLNKNQFLRESKKEGINLLSEPLGDKPCESVESFAQHLFET